MPDSMPFDCVWKSANSRMCVWRRWKLNLPRWLLCWRHSSPLRQKMSDEAKPLWRPSVKEMCFWMFWRFLLQRQFHDALRHDLPVVPELLCEPGKQNMCRILSCWDMGRWCPKSLRFCLHQQHFRWRHNMEVLARMSEKSFNFCR